MNTGNDDIVRIIGWIAVICIVAGIAWFVSRNAKESDIQKSEIVGESCDDTNRHSMCVICGNPATRYSVRTGRPWFDQLPVLRWLNQLYAMPWRYSIVDDFTHGLRLCQSHREAAEQRLEQSHAQMRSEHAQFNASQLQKVAMLEQGGLEQLVREDAEAIKLSIGLRGVVRRSIEQPRLLVASREETHVLPVATNSDK